MPTYVENLTTARNQVAANLAAITLTPKPTYSIDGESYSWESLFNSYTQQLAKLNELIAMGDSGGFEVRSQGVS